MDRYFNYSATAQLIIEPFKNIIISANQEACRLLQKDINQIINTSASDIFNSNFPDFIVFTQDVIENSRGWTDKIIIETANNHEPLEIRGRYTQAGDEHHLHLSLQRISELNNYRERSEMEHHYSSGVIHWNRVSKVFREFERENHLLLDAAGEGIYGVDANGITTFVNPAAERILGYKANELAGRNMHSMIHHTRTDGSHFCKKECPIFAAFQDGEVHTVEDDTFWSKNGKPIDVEYTSTPIRDNGTIAGAVIVFRDISQKKADKNRLLNALKEVESLKNKLELENSYLQEEINTTFNHHQIIGNSAAINNTLQQINLVGPTDATVLINGESGTGKELIARAIHENSSRAQRPLIKVNCAAIPEELFESEFFGHIKGAFTGATNDRAGRFELADSGTIFLDEVGEIPLRLQGKLLRVLQEQQFERLGDAKKTYSVDIRIIAATNKDLKQQVDKGLFREDLYFRLNVFPIMSAPLRERIVDIPLLTQHFLKKACSRMDKNDLKIPLSELEKLKSYHWPGNVRELENVVERQVILANAGSVRFDNLISPNTNIVSHDSALENNNTCTQTELKTRDRRNVIIALEKCQGKVSGKGGAAELLDMKPTTLSSRIKKYQIDVREFKSQ